MLTVKETLEFSSACQHDAPKGERARKVELVLQLLNLKHVENTIVGDELNRGVSGGEKRRVSIGAQWVKDACVYLLDVSTSIFTRFSF